MSIEIWMKNTLPRLRAYIMILSHSVATAGGNKIFTEDGEFGKIRLRKDVVDGGCTKAAAHRTNIW